MRRQLAPLALLTLAACTGGAGDPDISETVVGHCVYVNPFADQEECREFRGDGWTEEEAAANCAEEEATFEPGPCPYADTFGTCLLPDEDPERQVLFIAPGTDASSCPNQERGCELFAGGTFIPGNTCGGEGGTPIDEDDFYSESYVTPPELICKAPVDGEEPGDGPDGQVCTWQQMSGCTEPGRHFEDYASCDVVRTQRPYYPAPPSTDAPTSAVDDPRLADPVYASELAWVTSQFEACACVCCHAASTSPEGAAIFDSDAEGNWVNTFSDWGIAFGARAFDSSLLGSYQASENNGFSRFVAGMPSTDEPRMKAFFEAELAYRGRTVEEFSALGPQPAIFAAQANYVPAPCEEGEGVADDGTLTWTGGRARYVFVLDEGAANPGNPPNLDEPAGTRWKVDTVPPAIPMKTGEVRYGVVPEGTLQAVPDDGAPAALTPGETYTLYVLADIAVPITRCTFTFEP